MGSMQWQLGREMGTIPAFVSRTQENQENLGRDGRSQDLPDSGFQPAVRHLSQVDVEFYSKNKFEKLVHLVGFIIRIYHDARSSECQNNAPYMKLLSGQSMRLKQTFDVQKKI